MCLCVCVSLCMCLSTRFAPACMYFYLNMCTHSLRRCVYLFGHSLRSCVCVDVVWSAFDGAATGRFVAGGVHYSVFV